MTDFADDTVTVSNAGKELIALQANVEEHGDPVGGEIVCRDVSGHVRITLEAASEQFGGTAVAIQDGGYLLFATEADGQGHLRAALHSGDPTVNEDGGTLALSASNDPAQAPDGSPGTAIVLNAAQRSLVIRNEAGEPIVTLGSDGTGALVLRNSAGQPTLRLDGTQADLFVGGYQAGGDIRLFAKGANNADTSQASIHLRGSSPGFAMNVDGKPRARLDGVKSDLWLGGHGANGDVALFAQDGDNTTESQATVHIKGAGGEIVLRGGANHEARARLDGTNGDLWLGGNNVNGDLMLFDTTGDNKTSSKATIRLSGKSGDILLRNADCAEDFAVSNSESCQPGTVMVIDDSSLLSPCRHSYDRRVAGVISGASEYGPGVVLDRRPEERGRLPLALVGKVACRVDAGYRPISIGDLLTTSDTPGHAMKADDPTRAPGAVLGKALANLREGFGLIPILVTLQ
jgi:hypothetical protein